MRTCAKACLLTVVLACLVAPVAAQSPGNRAEPVAKEPQPTNTPTYEGRVEGDTIETPFVITRPPGGGKMFPSFTLYVNVSTPEKPGFGVYRKDSKGYGEAPS